jgi:hypothetical protein
VDPSGQPADREIERRAHHEGHAGQHRVVAHHDHEHPDEHQRRADQRKGPVHHDALDRVGVGHHPEEQVAGLLLVVEPERELLQVGPDRDAQVVDHPLAHVDREVVGQHGGHAAADRDQHDRGGGEAELRHRVELREPRPQDGGRRLVAEDAVEDDGQRQRLGEVEGDPEGGEPEPQRHGRPMGARVPRDAREQGEEAARSGSAGHKSTLC